MTEDLKALLTSVEAADKAATPLSVEIRQLCVFDTGIPFPLLDELSVRAQAAEEALPQLAAELRKAHERIEELEKSSTQHAYVEEHNRRVTAENKAEAYKKRIEKLEARTRQLEEGMYEFAEASDDTTAARDVLRAYNVGWPRFI